MTLRRAVMVMVGAATLTASGAYVFVYLYRWEWNRALISAAIFLAAEIAVLGWFLNQKLDAIRLDASDRNRQLRMQRITGHLDAARDQPSTVFKWLKIDAGGPRVFIPVLMGAGLVLAGIAWAVERIGRMTAGHMTDDRIASKLCRLSPPAGGFLDDSDDALRDLRGPGGGRW